MRKSTKAYAVFAVLAYAAAITGTAAAQSGPTCRDFVQAPNVGVFVDYAEDVMRKLDAQDMTRGCQSAMRGWGAACPNCAREGTATYIRNWCVMNPEMSLYVPAETLYNLTRGAKGGC